MYLRYNNINIIYALNDNFDAINCENVSNGEPSFNTGSSVNSPRSMILSMTDGPILSATFDNIFS